jgi:hypothetical protein
MGRHRRDPKKPLGNYDVGYCKTDPKTRFPHQKVSRKPQKRPKQPETLIEHFEDILDSTVKVRGQDGRVRRVKVRRGLAMTYVDKALKGDRQVFLAIMKLCAAMLTELEGVEMRLPPILEDEHEFVLRAVE